MARNEFVQVGYVVPDLEIAMAEWSQKSGVGPFIVLSHVRPENGLYRGQPSSLEISSAHAQAGPLQVELIQQHDAGPSVYRDAFPGNAQGMHHLCYWAEGSMADEIAYYSALGIEAAYTAQFGPLNFGYFDARKTHGCFIEVLEREPGTVALFDEVAKAGTHWNGEKPVRIYGAE